MKTENSGLTSAEARKNQLRYGYNELAKAKKTSAVSLFFGQFRDVLTLTLIAAMLLSAALGEYSDAITVMVIVLVNGVLGFVQEYKTEKSLEALNELSSPKAVVIRDGEEITVPSREVTVGDIVVLESGDRICADCTLLTSYSLCTDESPLTGESVPVEKDIHKDTSLYMGTTVTSGRGTARVDVIGMSTKMGSIAHMLENTTSEETPLKKHLNKIGKELVIICAAVCVLIFIAGMFHGETAFDMFMSAISLAVAAIPEGLPAVVTVSLTIGVARMLKRNALIRKLPAVETLGCTNVICTDKTGTLTQNKMTVREIYYDGKVANISDSGTISVNGREVNPHGNDSLSGLLSCGHLCNNSTYRNGEVSGDPTEVAIYNLTDKSFADKSRLSSYERISEIPFDSVRKCMSVVCSDGKGGKIAFVKGAADRIIDMCNRKSTASGVVDFADKSRVMKINDNMTGKALRVLGFAYKPITSDADDIESNLIFLGLQGMIDPPRAEAYKAVADCYEAGITPVMITGDHKNTAEAIADELGFRGNNTPLTGADIENMNDDELADAVGKTNVFARVSPEHKLRIVRAFKRRKNIVAMTGDGVNDAPSLKEADIGIAMGKCGTDVAKQSADMVLLDDNFSTIISAVEEGRVIYANIRKFIRYLLSCNLGEIILMGAAAFCGMPMPLVPIQILWLNLVTDGLPALALGVDTPEKDIMKRSPRKDGESIFSKGLGSNIVLSGILMGGEALLSFALARYMWGDLSVARSVAFATLIFAELLYSFECKSERGSILNVNITDNLYLLGAVALSAFLTMTVMYIPLFAGIFKTVPLTASQWCVVAATGSVELLLGVFFNQLKE
ncbi:MAG: cation-translocating P-type ATPase [Clostridia bacterium]|nr:cation-translocating P-type ATPase [Clostridia bacterium]